VPYAEPAPHNQSWNQRTWTDHGGPEPEPDPGADEQVRVWTTGQLRLLIRNLTPYVDGTFGTVSTKHGQLLMRAIVELNRLWSAQYRIPPPPPPPEPDIVEEEVKAAESARITRERVLDQLRELRTRTRP
jgi:hypothetical protein